MNDIWKKGGEKKVQTQLLQLPASLRVRGNESVSEEITYQLKDLKAE